MRKIASLIAVLMVITPVTGRAVEAHADHDVYALVTPERVTLGNSVVERVWRLDRFATTSLKDKRQAGGSFGERSDFSLNLDGVPVPSERFATDAVEVRPLPRGGLRVTFSLSLTPLVRARRVVESYPKVAGFSSRLSITPLIPLVLSGYTLDEVAAGAGLTPTIHAFRAAADWRFDDGWRPVSIGDSHPGDWRETTTAVAGSSLDAPGEWLSLADAGGRRLFIVMERHDYASSRVSYDGAVASAVVDLSRDIVYTGPFEEMIHIENPGPGPARHRVLLPGRTLELERVFTGFGADADAEPWQFYRYLAGHRLTPYRKAITFNTNQVDANRISTGAKDDVDFQRFISLAAAAREMGVDTFIFDDGWQARSGDWCPDSPACPEPRAGTFLPRFPDERFAAVRRVLAGDSGDPTDDIALGLWMSPMEFNPASTAFRSNPQWACAPLGHGTAAANLAQPYDGSNEAGIGVWNPEATGIHPDTGEQATLVRYIESRIRRAIEVYGARYFKFDFLVWTDCLGAEPVDTYGYHDSFLAMLDRLRAAHPDVTFQIDETNDYRLFPFESVARGPSWFQNGSPASTQLLHNLWNLAPFVPGYSLGQHALGNSREVETLGIDKLMAVALGSHITFWTEIDTQLDGPQRARVKKWVDFYKANREQLATFTYPLLDDPLKGVWAALQPWDPDTGNGFMLAYRQGAANATQAIPLRGVPDGTFTLTLIDPATSSSTALGTKDAAALRAGIEVTADPNGYAIVRVERVAG